MSGCEDCEGRWVWVGDEDITKSPVMVEGDSTIRSEPGPMVLSIQMSSPTRRLEVEQEACFKF
jgi:CheY-specific phosphatase CheX